MCESLYVCAHVFASMQRACVQVHTYGCAYTVCAPVEARSQSQVSWRRGSHLLWILLIQPGRLGQQVSGFLLAHLPSSGITGRAWLFPVHSKG